MKNQLFIICILASLSTVSQPTADSLDRKIDKGRLRTVILTESALYAGSMVALNSLWYQDHDRSKFHFFNDNDEWLQLDKAGHAFTAYQLGRLGMETLRWSGVKDKPAIWYGGSLGLLFLTSIEVFDGYSSAWGASTGDLIGNVTGAGLLIGQELLFHEQPVSLKFSFSRTSYPAYRPELLGKSLQEEVVKDYNGQTYWASVNLQAIGIIQAKPKWLNVAFGYGGTGMTGGSGNPLINDQGEAIPSFDRYRQYYLSLDVDLTKVSCRSKLLRSFFRVVSFVKVPFPAIEYNKKNGLRFHALYY